MIDLRVVAGYIQKSAGMSPQGGGAGERAAAQPSEGGRGERASGASEHPIRPREESERARPGGAIPYPLYLTR